MLLLFLLTLSVQVDDQVLADLQALIFERN